ncbi:MAG: hypothetical protein OHK0029_19070 [Armatimonadaceae bacterium]
MSNESGLNDSCIVAISGDQGSGKSTVGKLIASALGCAVYSTGDMQRRMATGLGLTSLELNRLAETDPSIDRRIDSSTLEIAENEQRVVFDSRLAWRFVPQAFKVFLTVDPVIGARRIIDAKRGQVEQYGSLDEALTQIQARRDSEDARFREMYDVRLNHLTNYDLILDSSHAEPDAIAQKVVECVRWHRAGVEFAPVWLSPRTPFPLTEPTPANRPADHQTMPLLRYERHYFLFGGIPRLEEALQSPEPLTGFRLMAVSDGAPEQVRELISGRLSMDTVREWEQRHGFTYPSYPQTLLTEGA